MTQGNASVPAPAEVIPQSSPVYDYNSSCEYYPFDYDYEYDASIDHLPLKEFVPMVTFYTLIGMLGIVGNLLVIFSIMKVKRMRSITNLFLLSLATADLLLVCVCVPAKVSVNTSFRNATCY